MSRVTAIIAKDLRTEVRGGGRFLTIVLFAVTVLVTLGFALPSDSPARSTVAAGFIWTSIFLSAVLDLRTSWDAEHRDGMLDALRISRTTPAEIFLAKFATSFLSLALLAAVTVVAAAFGFGGESGKLLHAWLSITAGTVSVVAWGTLISALCIRVRSGDVLLPILLFPLIIPATIASVSLTSSFLNGTEVATGAWIVLASVGLIAFGTSLALFEYALDE